MATMLDALRRARRVATGSIAVWCDGLYRSGDLGFLDTEGCPYLVDRAEEMIVTGGENVCSVEVEDVLSRHPAVLEAAVAN